MLPASDALGEAGASPDYPLFTQLPLAVIRLLQGHKVSLLVDVRTVPRSFRNPQFNKASLPGDLKKAGVQFYKTPDAVLRAQIEAYDKVVAKKSAENPLFKKVLDSQRAFAQRVGSWYYDYTVDMKMAYNHYFGKK